MQPQAGIKGEKEGKNEKVDADYATGRKPGD